jgi:hypothetical protein
MSDLTFEEKQQAALRHYQARYDAVLQKVGSRAPEPTLGQSELDYRRETCRMMKRAYLPQNHKLYQVTGVGLNRTPCSMPWSPTCWLLFK